MNRLKFFYRVQNEGEFVVYSGLSDKAEALRLADLEDGTVETDYRDSSKYMVKAYKQTVEVDFISNSLSKLVLKRKFGNYRLTSIDRKRPDIISYKHYNTPYFWWIVLLANLVEDPFFETEIGRVFLIPNEFDIQDFAQGYVVR